VTYRFEQIFRTPASEQWSVLRDARSDDEVAPIAGRVDVHFDRSYARVTIVLRDDVSDDDATALLARVDEQLVPLKSRGDVRITLWRGAHEGTFAPQRNDE
jgi:uncharacterized protein YhfF